MAGDFNCVLNSKLDKLPADTGPISKKSRSLNALIKEFGLIATFITPGRKTLPLGQGAMVVILG